MTSLFAFSSFKFSDQTHTTATLGLPNHMLWPKTIRSFFTKPSALAKTICSSNFKAQPLPEYRNFVKRISNSISCYCFWSDGYYWPNLLYIYPLKPFFFLFCFSFSCSSRTRTRTLTLSFSLSRSNADKLLSMAVTIVSVRARQIFDSRGNPTVEVCVVLSICFSFSITSWWYASEYFTDEILD